MNRDAFTLQMHGLLSGRASGATPTWIKWAEECVANKQYAFFKEQPDDIAVGQWLGQLYAAMYFVHREYGEDAAVRTWELASVSCLYPFELKRAAEYLAAGGDPHGIVAMIDEGTLVDDTKLPTIQDVHKDKQARASMHNKKGWDCR